MDPAAISEFPTRPFARIAAQGPVDERPRKQMRLRRCVACHLGMICESGDEMVVPCGKQQGALPCKPARLLLIEGAVGAVLAIGLAVALPPAVLMASINIAVCIL